MGLKDMFRRVPGSMAHSRWCVGKTL